MLSWTVLKTQTLREIKYFTQKYSANEAKKYTAIFRTKFYHFFSAKSQFRLGQTFPGQVRLT